MWGNLRDSLANAAEGSIQNIQTPGKLMAKFGEVVAPTLEDDEEYESDGEFDEYYEDSSTSGDEEEEEIVDINMGSNVKGNKVGELFYQTSLTGNEKDLMLAQGATLNRTLLNSEHIKAKGREGTNIISDNKAIKALHNSSLNPIKELVQHIHPPVLLDSSTKEKDFNHVDEPAHNHTLVLDDKEKKTLHNSSLNSINERIQHIHPPVLLDSCTKEKDFNYVDESAHNHTLVLDDKETKILHNSSLNLINERVQHITQPVLLDSCSKEKDFNYVDESARNQTLNHQLPTDKKSCDLQELVERSFSSSPISYPLEQLDKIDDTVRSSESYDFESGRVESLIPTIADKTTIAEDCVKLPLVMEDQLNIRLSQSDHNLKYDDKSSFNDEPALQQSHIVKKAGIDSNEKVGTHMTDMNKDKIRYDAVKYSEEKEDGISETNTILQQIDKSEFGNLSSSSMKENLSNNAKDEEVRLDECSNNELCSIYSENKRVTDKNKSLSEMEVIDHQTNNNRLHISTKTTPNKRTDSLVAHDGTTNPAKDPIYEDAIMKATSQSFASNKVNLIEDYSKNLEKEGLNDEQTVCKANEIERQKVELCKDYACNTSKKQSDDTQKSNDEIKIRMGIRISEMEKELFAREQKSLQDQKKFLTLLEDAESRALNVERERESEIANKNAHTIEIQKRHSVALSYAEQKADRYTIALNEKKNELKQLHAVISEMKSTIKENAGVTEEAEEEADELLHENEQLREKLEGVVNENKQLKRDMINQKEDRSKLAGAQTDLQNLKKEQNLSKNNAIAMTETHSSNLASVTTERDAAKAEVLDIKQQLTALEADIGIVKADYTRVMLANSNLQSAIEAFQMEREGEISLFEESKISAEEALTIAHETLLNAAREANEISMREVQSASNKAVTNTMEELDSTIKILEECRKENVQLRRSLDEAILRLHTNQDDVVDRSLMKNVLLDWYSKSGKSRRDVFLMIASLLHFTEVEKDKCGIGKNSGLGKAVVGAVAPPLSPAAKKIEQLEGDTVREKWVNFLLAESDDVSTNVSDQVHSTNLRKKENISI